MKLKIEYVPIDSIKPYAGNAKLHPQEQIDQIKRSADTPFLYLAKALKHGDESE